jgi:hypothetical protein
LVCGSSRECDLRLTQMALVTLQLFSRLWQYKSQAFFMYEQPFVHIGVWKFPRM